MSNDSDDKTLLSDSDAVAPTPVDGDESYCAACGGSFPFDLDVCPKDGARLTKLKARPDALLGRVFDGRFEVRTSLGQGGMGTVYRGWQLTVDREIAIKVIHPKLASDRVAVKRFLREARLSSRLNQPNIVNVYDFGQTEDGILYIAMELLRGHTLGRELEAMRPLPLRRVLTIGQQLCDALDSAHGQGIVHRDLKPNNIVILDDPPGRDLIKVLDFGLAKSLVNDTSSLVTHSNAILGTPLYMPPEQIEGQPSDQRADLYSLGCILYQMLSGRPPFVADSVNLVLAKHVSEKATPLPDGVTPVLVTAVERLMEKDPAKRMQSAREVREVMQSIVEAGFTQEVNDTTPEVRPPDSGPIELAVTHPAVSSAKSISVESSIDLTPVRTRRRWLAPVVVTVLATGAGASYLVVRGLAKEAQPTPVIAPSDGAAVPATADAAVVTPDAPALESVEIDAAAPVPIDAPKKPARPNQATVPKAKPPGATPTRPPETPVTPPAPPDAAGDPNLPWLKPKKAN